MTFRATPFLWPSLLSLTACSLFGLSDEERQNLALYQSNAALYFEGQRYDQAWASVRRGLEISPDDYKLTSLGARLMMLVDSSDAENLERAAEMFQKLEDMRSIDDHAPHALLGLGDFHQQFGLRHWRQAALLETEAAGRDLTKAERDRYLLQASEYDDQAEYHWRKAVRFFDALITREELLRIAHKHLMEIAIERNDYDEAVEHAHACLTRNVAEQEVKQAIIRETMSVEFERATARDLQLLIDQEKRVRVALAEMHYRTAHYTAAVEELTKLLELDPTRSSDYYNRASAREALGENEDARRDYERFLASTKLPASDQRVLNAVRFTQSK